MNCSPPLKRTHNGATRATSECWERLGNPFVCIARHHARLRTRSIIIRIAAFVAAILVFFWGGDFFFFSLFFLPLVVFVFFLSSVVPAGSRLSFSLRFVVWGLRCRQITAAPVLSPRSCRLFPRPVRHIYVTCHEVVKDAALPVSRPMRV